MRDLRVAFVGPFACMGLVGGWLTQALLRGGPDAGTVCLVLVTPITAALLGAVLFRGRRRWKALAFGFPFLVVGAGLCNGLSIALIMSVIERGRVGDIMAMGAMMGAACGVPFIPAMLWTFLLAVRIDGVREGSVLDAAYRRAPWGAAAASSAIAVWVVQHRTPEHLDPLSGAAAVILGVGAVALVAILVADVRALLRARERARLAPTLVGAQEASLHAHYAQHPGEILDLGVGEELMAEQVPAAESAYRANALRVTRLRGTFSLAKRKLLRVVVADAIAVSIATACVAHIAVCGAKTAPLPSYHDAQEAL